MNKIVKLGIIIICITISLTGITFAGVTIYNTFIKKQDKMETRGLFDDGRGYTDYENDLMANDMIWQSDVRLYYRAITNSKDYEKYKLRISAFPEVSDINFDENFVIIIANENFRDFDEIDMEISNIYADETTTNVIMKQKENADMNDTTNVWYAIVDKSQLKDNVKITIEHKNFSNDNFTKISELPSDYSVNDAIEDGCFTLKNNKIVSANENQLDEFMEETKKGEKCFIRIYSNYNEEVNIKDVNFENGIYYTDEIVLDTGRKYHNTYKKLEKKEIKNGEYKDIEYVFLEGRNSNGGVPLVIIQNWLEEYKKENDPYYKAVSNLDNTIFLTDFENYVPNNNDIEITEKKAKEIAQKGFEESKIRIAREGTDDIDSETVKIEEVVANNYFTRYYYQGNEFYNNIKRNCYAIQRQNDMGCGVTIYVDVSTGLIIAGRAFGD